MELRKKFKVTNVRLILIITVVSALLAGTILFFIIRNVRKEEPRTRIPDFVQDIKTENITDKKDRYNIEIKYPVTARNKINEEIKGYVDHKIEEFLSNIKAEEDGEIRANEEAGETADEGTTGTIPEYKLFIDFIAYEYSEDIVSFKLDAYEFTGGTRENKYVKTYIYNIYSNKLMGIGDILTGNFEKALSDICKEQLKSKMGEYYDEVLVTQGAGPKRENFEKCVLDKDMLTIFFEPYSVGPWDAGEQSCEISYLSLTAFLNEAILKK